MNHSRSSLPIVVALAFALGLSACDNNKNPPSEQMSSTPSDVPKQVVSPAPQAQEPTGGVPIPATPAVDPAHLEDAEIAAVLIAINDGEIQEAELATTRGKSDDVKTFASHMLKAHKSMLDDSNKAFLRAKLTPSANAVSDQLNADIKDEVLNLQTRQGQAFDEAYIDDQLKAHEKALSLIDEMAPNAKDTNLQAKLRADRTKIEKHQKEVQKVERSLQPGNTNMQGSTTK